MRSLLKGLVFGAALAAALASVPAVAGENAERNFRFLAVADTHFWELEKHPKGLQAFKAWLGRIKHLKADFMVVLGDVCGDRYAALPQAKKIADESGLKVHFLPGNHDDAYGRKPEYWQKAFGRHYYSFDHKGWHVISHWSQKRQPQWLAADLAKVRPGTPIMFWQHYPPVERGKIYPLLVKHKVRLVMSGHVHGLRTGMLGALRDANLNTFGTGFAVVDVLKDGRVALQWRPQGVSKRLVIEHPAEGDAVAAGEQKVLVTAFDSTRDVVKLEYNAGAGWKKLEKSTGWSWTATAQLRGGQVQVRARDSAGEEWTAASKYSVAARPVVKLGADWPVWGGTPENRRCAKSVLAPPLRLAWHAQIRGRAAQPVLSGGRLYVASASQDFEESNALVCLEAISGKELWRAPLLSNPMGPAAVSGKVVGVADGHGRAYGFDVNTGRELWRTQGLATYGSYGKSGGITAADGVFLAGNTQALAAATGKNLWPQRATLAQTPICPPAVSGGKAVGAGTGWQQCRDLKTGRELWKVTPSTYRATVAVNGNFLLGGRSLVGAIDGKSIKKGYKLSSGGAGALTPDGSIFVTGNHPGRIMAVDLAAGKLLWQFPARQKFSLSDTSISGGNAWVWGADGFLRAMSVKPGKEVWKRRFGVRLSGPVISGNALFVAGGGCVYALTGRTK